MRRGGLGVPQVWPGLSSSLAHSAAGTSSALVLSSPELEHTGKSICTHSLPHAPSLPPPFIYGTAISFWREVASSMKWQKGLNENKVFA